MFDTHHRTCCSVDLGGAYAMTERQQDERDLAILKQYEMGVSKRELVRRHGVTKHYLNKLLKEALEQ